MEYNDAEENFFKSQVSNLFLLIDVLSHLYTREIIFKLDRGEKY